MELFRIPLVALSELKLVLLVATELFRIPLVALTELKLVLLLATELFRIPLVATSRNEELTSSDSSFSSFPKD